jgi:hypothetical protein
VHRSRVLREWTAKPNSRSTRQVHDMKCRRHPCRHPADRVHRLARGHPAHNPCDQFVRLHVVAGYQLVSPDNRHCHVFALTALKCPEQTMECASHTQELSNRPTEQWPENPSL